MGRSTLSLGDIGRNLVTEHLGVDLFDSTKRKVPKDGIESSFLDVVRDNIGAADLQGLTGEAGLPDLVKRLGTSVAAHYSIIGGAQMAGLISEGMATTLGGPAGAAAAIILEEAATYAGKQFLGESHHSYKVGDWVQIDNGTETVTVKTKRLAESMLGSMFEDFPDDEDFDAAAQESYSVGFVTAVGEKGDVTVYNFKFGKEQALDEAFLRPASETMAAQFSGNGQLAAVRRLRLQLDQMEGSPLVNSPVPTDPGTAVFLDGEPFHIIQCIGTAALVENGSGHQVLVDVRQLAPGATKHTRRHNYRSDGTVDDSMYQTEGGNDLAQGQWVWIRPGPKELFAYSNCQAELACVMTIVGPLVKVAGAFRGDVTDVPLNQALPISEDIRQVLNSWHHFATFREAAVTGYALHRKAPGNWYPEVALGVGPMADLLGELEFPDLPETVEVSGRMDAVTPGETFGTVPSGTSPAADADLKDDLVDNGGMTRGEADVLVDHAETEGQDSAAPVNYAVIAGAVAAAVVLAVYLS